MLTAIHGCGDQKQTATSYAPCAIPAAIHSYEVPVADTSTIPELIHLRPGQSAILLEDIVAKARIPAQGDELYVGPVVLQRGTVVIKPKVEQ